MTRIADISLAAAYLAGFQDAIRRSFAVMTVIYTFEN